MSGPFSFSFNPDGPNTSPPPGFGSIDKIPKPEAEPEYDPPQSPTPPRGEHTRAQPVGGNFTPNTWQKLPGPVAETSDFAATATIKSEPVAAAAAASDPDGAKQSSAAAAAATKSYVCLTCDRNFKGPQGLGSHMANRHRPPPPPPSPPHSKSHVCPICHGDFRGPHRLESHMLTHNNPPPTTRGKKKKKGQQQTNRKEAPYFRERRMEKPAPRTGGVGECSYQNDSNSQNEVWDIAETLLNKAVAQLNVKILSSSTIRAADLCCSLGPNSFRFADNTVRAVKLLYESIGLNCQMPAFEIFFNVQNPNDFNLLCKSLPQNGHYYAAAVPGSLYGRLFPEASLQIVHSSHSLGWLSKVPQDVVDKNSPAWNKGRIHYSNSREEVVKAYEAQYAEDMECFLHARAQEIVSGGLMLLTILGRPDGTPHSHCVANITYQILGSCLMDMAQKGVVGEEQVDAFNIPVYYMSLRELEATVERNGCFRMERMITVSQLPALDNKVKSSRLIVSEVRSATEVPLKEHFGEEILDQLFELYRKKIEELPSILESGKAINFVIMLKRKAG